MERPEVARARTLLVTSAQGAGLWALGRVSHLLLLARARIEPKLVNTPVPALLRARAPRVQRFGKNLWQRITTRFPALAELLDEAIASAPAAQNGFAKQPSSTASAASAQTAPREPEESLPSLIEQLRDQSAETAAIAAIKLGARREPEARAALHELLKNSDGYFNPLTRVAALQAFTHTLPHLPSVVELEPLIELVRDVDAEVSMAAIDAVAQRAPSNVAIDQLLPVVLDETGYFLPIVRAAATRALERAGLLTTANA